ncbi:MAG: ImmA/IrrE family metallo-endopeptidase [Acutalibacteraceae bacterium]|nr:ImmA/IrrE family metallo-endopeptidase [Acutalibacteraceae bacterium]
MRNVDFVSNKVAELVKKYNTRDPFKLCEELNIKIRYKDLGLSMKAFYFYQSRIKNIVINNRVEPIVRNILCAHELGHAVLHGELAAMKGFRELELFDSIIPTEYEANLFAAELLINDTELLELLNDSEKSFFSVAKELYVPTELLDFKFRALKNKGYRIESPIISKSNFLKNNIDGCFS